MHRSASRLASLSPIGDQISAVTYFGTIWASAGSTANLGRVSRPGMGEGDHVRNGPQTRCRVGESYRSANSNRLIEGFTGGDRLWSWATSENSAVKPPPTVNCRWSLDAAQDPFQLRPESTHGALAVARRHSLGATVHMHTPNSSPFDSLSRILGELRFVCANKPSERLFATAPIASCPKLLSRNRS